MRQEAQIKARAAALWQFLNGTEGEFRERVLRSGFWVVASSVGIRTVEFTRSIILARLLVPEVFGLMGIAAFILSGLDAFTQTGYGAALIHRQEKSEEVYDTSWVIAMVRGVALAALVALAAPWVASFYDQPRLTSIIRVVAFSPLIFGFQNVNMVRFRRDLDFKRLALLQQGATLFGAIVVVGLAWWLRSVWALVIGNLASALITVALSFAIQREWPRPRFRLDVARELYHYGRFVTAASVVIFLALQLDNAVVGKLLGMEALGFYLVAYTLANLPTTHISYLVSNIMMPSYSQLQREPERLRRVYLKTLKLTATVSVPAAAGLAVLAPDIAGVVYGPKWLPMVGALQVLCAHGLLRSIQCTSGPFFNAVGHPKYDFYSNALRVAVIALAIVPLTNRLGIVGTSLCVSLGVATCFAASFYLLAGVTGLHYGPLLAQVYPAFVGSAAMAAGVYGLRATLGASNPAGLVALVLAGGLLYFAALLLIDRRLVPEVIGALRGK